MRKLALSSLMAILSIILCWQTYADIQEANEFDTQNTVGFLTASQVNLVASQVNLGASQVNLVASQTGVAEQIASHNPDFPTYMVGSELSYEPFGFKDKKGRPIGFEVELLEAVGKAAQFNVVFIHRNRLDLEETLNDDTFAIWASALSISPERSEKIDMSEPYLNFTREVRLLAKPENEHLQTLADFKGKKIAVNAGSQNNIETAQTLTESENNVIRAGSFYLSLAAMYNGEADGVLGDSTVLHYYQAKHAEQAEKAKKDVIQTRAISLNEAPKQLAFAVKKGNEDVLKKINQGLASVKADGTYDQLLAKWFPDYRNIEIENKKEENNKTQESKTKNKKSS